MRPLSLLLRVRPTRTIANYIVLAAWAATALPAQEETFSIHVEMVWASSEARDAVTAFKATEDVVGQPDDLHAFRLDAARQGKREADSQRRVGSIVPLLEETMVVAPDREASFLIGGRSVAPSVRATATIEERGPQALDIVAPPLPQQESPSPKRTERDFGLKVAFRPHKARAGDLYIQLDALINGVDFERSKQAGDRITPQLTFREFSDVLRVQSDQTIAVAGLLTDEDLRALRRAPGLENSPVLSRVASLRQSDPSGSILLLITPRFSAARTEGGIQR